MISLALRTPARSLNRHGVAVSHCRCSSAAPLWHNSSREPGSDATVVGDMYPNTGFVGIDLSAIQPTYVAPNVKFFIDDMEHENGWTFSENSLDYIHIRHVMPGIKNRKQLLERIFRYVFHSPEGGPSAPIPAHAPTTILLRASLAGAAALTGLANHSDTSSPAATSSSRRCITIPWPTMPP